MNIERGMEKGDPSVIEFRNRLVGCKTCEEFNNLMTESDLPVRAVEVDSTQRRNIPDGARGYILINEGTNEQISPDVRQGSWIGFGNLREDIASRVVAMFQAKEKQGV